MRMEKLSHCFLSSSLSKLRKVESKYIQLALYLNSEFCPGIICLRTDIWYQRELVNVHWAELRQYNCMVRAAMRHDSFRYKEGHLTQAPNLLTNVFGRCKEMGASTVHDRVGGEILRIALCCKHPQ